MNVIVHMLTIQRERNPVVDMIHFFQIRLAIHAQAVLLNKQFLHDVRGHIAGTYLMTP